MKCQLHGQPGALAMERGDRACWRSRAQVQPRQRTLTTLYCLEDAVSRSRESGDCKPLIQRCLGRLVGIEALPLVGASQVTENTLPLLPTMPGLPRTIAPYCTRRSRSLDHNRLGNPQGIAGTGELVGSEVGKITMTPFQSVRWSIGWAEHDAPRHGPMTRTPGQS